MASSVVRAIRNSSSMHFDELNISSGNSEKLFCNQRSEPKPNLKSQEKWEKTLISADPPKGSKNEQKLKQKIFSLGCKKLRGLNLIVKK